MAALIESLPARIKLPRRLLMIGRALPRGLDATTHSPGHRRRRSARDGLCRQAFAARRSKSRHLVGAKSGGAGMGTWGTLMRGSEKSFRRDM